MDGTGYPAGIVGEGIDADARLLAVCDTLEALSHPRPYRDGLPPRDALTRIRMHVLLRKLCEAHKPAVLLVTHDVDEAIVLADRVIVLDDGVVSRDLRVDLAGDGWLRPPVAGLGGRADGPRPGAVRPVGRRPVAGLRQEPVQLTTTTEPRGATMHPGAPSSPAPVAG